MKRWILLALTLVLLSAAPSQAQIASVTAGDGGNNGGASNSLTFSVTVNSGESLAVGFAGDTSVDDISSVIWNTSENLALIDKLNDTAAPVNDRRLYFYFIASPTAGTHNVVITAASSHYILAGWATYSGMNASGQPDNHTTSIGTGQTATLTTVADQCWTIAVAGGTFFAAQTAGTGSTRRVKDGAFNTWGIFDSNAAISPAASYSMTVSNGGNGVGIIMASFAPSGAAPPSSTPQTLPLLGAGPGQ